MFNYKSQFEGTRYDRVEQNFLGTFGLLVTNFVSTALITYKLWYVRRRTVQVHVLKSFRYYRRNIKKYINRSGGNTKVENVLILLMETGGLYLIFWVS